jgi:hypothetical protein
MLTLLKKHWIVDNMSVLRDFYLIVDIEKFSNNISKLFEEKALVVKPYLRTEKEIIYLINQILLGRNFNFPSKFDAERDIEFDDIRFMCYLEYSEEKEMNSKECSGIYLRIDSFMQSLFVLNSNFMVIEVGFCDGHMSSTSNFKPLLCLKEIVKVLQPFFGFSSADNEDQNRVDFKQPWTQPRDLMVFNSSHKFWFDFYRELKLKRNEIFEWSTFLGSIEWIESPIGIGNFVNPKELEGDYIRHKKAIEDIIKVVFSFNLNSHF